MALTRSGLREGSLFRAEDERPRRGRSCSWSSPRRLRSRSDAAGWSGALSFASRPSAEGFLTRGDILRSSLGVKAGARGARLRRRSAEPFAKLRNEPNCCYAASRPLDGARPCSILAAMIMVRGGPTRVELSQLMEARLHRYSVSSPYMRMYRPSTSIPTNRCWKATHKR